MTPSRLAASCAAILLLAGSLAAQRPTPARARPAAARPDTARRDTAAVKDSVSKFLESFNYRSLGPAAYSGRVTALAVPNSREPRPKTWYVGAAGGGVWKTANGGITWQSVSSGLGSETVGDLAVAPSDSNVLWVGTGEKNSLRSQYWGAGAYKTTDGGRTWKRLTDPALKNGLPTDRIGRIGIAISAQNPKLVFAFIQVDRGITEAAQGRFGGVFRSADAGGTWTQVNDLQAIPHYYYDEIWVDPADSQHVFVNSSSLLESKDGGRTFAPESLSRGHGGHAALRVDPPAAGHRLLG